MELTAERLLNHIYYNKLPQIYRDMDMGLKTLPLKRYLSSLIEGGYSEALKDINSLLNLIDPQKCPEEFLPMLCDSFGLSYFEDIAPIYQRKFLQNIGEITRRRGTYSCVKYLVKVLTGLDVELDYYRDESGSRVLDIFLLARTLKQVEEINTSISVIQRYVQTQIPYYIHPRVSSKISSQTLRTHYYTAGAITSFTQYNLIPTDRR